MFSLQIVLKAFNSLQTDAQDRHICHVFLKYHQWPVGNKRPSNLTSVLNKLTKEVSAEVRTCLNNVNMLNYMYCKAQ